MNTYILDGKTPIKTDTSTWGRWFKANEETRRVGRAEIGDVTVSTVFLGLDHQHTSDGPPLLFETMIFGGPLDEYCARCSTWDEAEDMHAHALALVRDHTPDN